jgi:hypothetical protein
VVDAVRARFERSALEAAPEAAARGIGVVVAGFIAAVPPSSPWRPSCAAVKWSRCSSRRTSTRSAS